jgi:protein SCO1/2
MLVRIPLCSLILLCVALSGMGGPVVAGEAASADRVVTTTADYTVPNIRLVRDDGTAVSLADEMNDGRAVVLNFIFTTCSSFCPLSSQTFALFQHKLGPDRGRVHLMSISIDPEQDTPARLREYARKYHAGPGWQHYTGTLEASRAAQRAFGAYQGDKMSHAPLTLVRAADGRSWRRIEGFVTPDELLSEYRQALASK